MSADEKKSLSPEVKAKWVSALRSGKYEQCQGQLRLNDDQFCCLGVLCDIVDPQWRKRIDDYVHASGSVMFTPSQIRADVGLSTDAEGKLMHMNDDGQSFAKIAAYIEKNL